MAQTYRQVVNPPALFASNLRITGVATETIALDAIPGLGYRNLSVVIVNHSGTTSACALYGSPDGLNYVAVTGFSTFANSTGEIKYATATAIFQYYRVTTTGVAVEDVYLYGTP